MCSSGGAVAPVHHRCNGPCRRHVISIRGVGNGASPLIHVSPRGNVKLPRLIAVAAHAPTARGSCSRGGLPAPLIHAIAWESRFALHVRPARAVAGSCPRADQLAQLHLSATVARL
jgi:hypothetical protein